MDINTIKESLKRDEEDFKELVDNVLNPFAGEGAFVINVSNPKSISERVEEIRNK